MNWLGDMTKVMAELTEFKRLAAVLASRIEENTNAMDRNSALLERLERKIDSIRNAK